MRLNSGDAVIDLCAHRTRTLRRCSSGKRARLGALGRVGENDARSEGQSGYSLVARWWKRPGDVLIGTAWGAAAATAVAMDRPSTDAGETDGDRRTFIRGAGDGQVPLMLFHDFLDGR